MFQIDDIFLLEVGLESLSNDEKEGLLLCVEEELQVRIGALLSSNMDDEQLAHFEYLVAQNQQQLAIEWLNSNCSDYKQIVAHEVDKLKDEIKNNKDVILGGG
ncbi:MAG: DUF5663 domain-containing protein [Candidatus Woesebacteria bacterium]|jgi:hypothetical protein